MKHKLTKLSEEIVTEHGETTHNIYSYCESHDNYLWTQIHHGKTSLTVREKLIQDEK